MTKYFCDACGKEVSNRNQIVELTLHAQLTDRTSDGSRTISTESLDLCRDCAKYAEPASIKLLAGYAKEIAKSCFVPKEGAK